MAALTPPLAFSVFTPDLELPHKLAPRAIPPSTGRPRIPKPHTCQLLLSSRSWLTNLTPSPLAPPFQLPHPSTRLSQPRTFNTSNKPSRPRFNHPPHTHCRPRAPSPSLYPFPRNSVPSYLHPYQTTANTAPSASSTPTPIPHPPRIPPHPHPPV